MAYMLDVLPAELIARIFSFLDDRRDVSRCRLVCKTFHELSSTFLITQVVFALRLDTITRMQEVIGHPYFSKYVDTLVYDASKYRSRLARDWMSYTARCLDAPRELVDQEWIDRKQADQDILTKLRNLNLHNENFGGMQASEPAHGNFNGQEQLYRMGCQKTFPEYLLRYKNQETMNENEIPQRVLRDAFRRLPRLRHIVLGDYRYLARPGESYGELCNRLFGLVLEPTHLHSSAQTTFDIAAISDATVGLDALRISSFTTALHPFISANVILSGTVGSCETPGIYDIEQLAGASDQHSSVHCIFKGLRELNLSFEDIGNDWSGFDHLLSLARDVERLTLAVSKDRKWAQPDRMWQFLQQPTYFEDFLSTFLPRLKYLELRHLQLPNAQLLQGYLEPHALTLRELRLIEACLTDRAGEQDMLAEWVGKHLHLAGVEVLTAADLSMLAKINSLYTDEEEVDVEAREKMAAACWKKIEEREAKYLGGRSTNTLVRRTVDIADRTRSVEEWKMPWWKRPCHM